MKCCVSLDPIPQALFIVSVLVQRSFLTDENVVAELKRLIFLLDPIVISSIEVFLVDSDLLELADTLQHLAFYSLLTPRHLSL